MNAIITRRVYVKSITVGHGSSDLGIEVTLNDDWTPNPKEDFPGLKRGDFLNVAISRDAMHTKPEDDAGRLARIRSIVTEWGNGCSNGREECESCAATAMKAIITTLYGSGA